MNLSTQKRLAAEVLGCGISRVRIKESKDVEEALTREDIRTLIKKGLIWKIQKKGTSRGKARKLLSQKRRGRKRGHGSRKGHVKTRKQEWISRIRAQRKILADFRDAGSLERRDYRKLYGLAKGGMFRSKKHILSYVKEHELLKGGKG